MTEEERKGPWTRTVSGRVFWPLDPRPEEVFIEDVAHSLSHLCRFNGHPKYFYCVAEHAVRVSNLIEAQQRPVLEQFIALHHDDGEAYMGDVIAPLKLLPEMKWFRDAEDHLLLVVLQSYDVPGLQKLLANLINPPLPARIHTADLRVLITEMRDLTNWDIHDLPERIQGYYPVPGTIYPLGPSVARKLYMDRHNALMQRLT